jgi:hypothetical protein
VVAAREDHDSPADRSLPRDQPGGGDLPTPIEEARWNFALAVDSLELGRWHHFEKAGQMKQWLELRKKAMVALLPPYWY